MNLSQFPMRQDWKMTFSPWALSTEQGYSGGLTLKNGDTWRLWTYFHKQVLQGRNCVEYFIHNGAGKVRWRELWDAGRLQNLGQDVDAASDIKINVIYWCLLIHLQRIDRRYELSNLPTPWRLGEICWWLEGDGDVADGDLSRPMCDLGRWWGEVHSYEAAPGKSTGY